MKANKILAIGLTFILTCVPVRVFAASEQEGTLTLNATVPATYELSIPITSMNINYDEQTQAIGTLSVKGNIEADKKVTVSVKEKNNFKTVSNSSDVVGIPFKVIENGTEFSNEVWTADEISAVIPKEISLFLQFETDAWTMAHSGDYIGSIVFSAELN